MPEPKPKGYARIPVKVRCLISDVALVAAFGGTVAGLVVPPQMAGLWLRLPVLVAAGLLAGVCWFVHRRLKDKASVPLRAGTALGAAGACLLAMTFHRAGGLTSLGGLLCLISVLTARGSLDIAKPHTPPDWRRTGWSVLRDNIESLAGALIIVLIVWHFCLEAFKIPTGSMLPTLYGDNVWGDRVLVDKFAYEFTDPARWEPVVFRYPLRRTDPYVKRNIGLPGEQVLVAHGDVYVRKSPTADVELLSKTGGVRQTLWYPVIGPVRSGKDFLARLGREGKVEFNDGAASFGAEGGAIFYPKDESGRPGNVTDHDPSGQGHSEMGYSRRVVGDLRLSARLRPAKARSSPVEFIIIRDDDEYALRVEAESCTLMRRRRTGEKTFSDWERLKAPELKEIASGAEFSFGLADGVLAVELSGTVATEIKVGSALLEAFAARDAELVRQGKPRTSLESAEAMKLASAEPGPGRRGQVRINSGAGEAVEMLGVDRDIYYVGRVIDTPDGQKELPFALTLGADQYFVLGDNSPGSKDTRFWIEVFLEMEDGAVVSGGLDDAGQYLASLLHGVPGGETLKYRVRTGKDEPYSALMSLQRVARFTHAERGNDQPSDRVIYQTALANLKRAAREQNVARLPFITTGGHEVSVDVNALKSLHVRLMSYVKRDLFVGRTFAVFLWPNRMKLID